MNFDSILEKLEESTNFTKNCSFGGFKFTMRVLSFSEEQKLSKIIDEISESEDFGSLNDWKKYVVAMSICALEDTKLADSIETSGGEKIEKSLYLKDKLDKLPAKITEALFEVYTDLKEESEKSVDTNLEYNWFKDPAQREAEAAEKLEAEKESQAQEIARLKAIAGDEEGLTESPEGLLNDDGEAPAHNGVPLVNQEPYGGEIDLQKVTG
jgi:hypothetical protein